MTNFDPRNVPVGGTVRGRETGTVYTVVSDSKFHTYNLLTEVPERYLSNQKRDPGRHAAEYSGLTDDPNFDAPRYRHAVSHPVPVGGTIRVHGEPFRVEGVRIMDETARFSHIYQVKRGHTIRSSAPGLSRDFSRHRAPGPARTDQRPTPRAKAEDQNAPVLAPEAVAPDGNLPGDLPVTNGWSTTVVGPVSDATWRMLFGGGAGSTRKPHLTLTLPDEIRPEPWDRVTVNGADVTLIPTELVEALRGDLASLGYGPTTTSGIHLGNAEDPLAYWPAAREFVMGARP